MYKLEEKKSFNYRNFVAKVVLSRRKVIKFKWFQIKINNRILVTHSVLRDMSVVANNLYHYLE